ncbi:hypothetical protein [Suipraeoptans intestinalis]|uniref:hypothetical protein n=1 Tax=Suipraeoptans intestinalis TaxID=2606628 RepID=UPI002A76239E|nr:hypothetical protein [Suipraeoptans intestinalis]MDY3121263.1 hypothetical protein [Suipraeoptans intestinalis]
MLKKKTTADIVVIDIKEHTLNNHLTHCKKILQTYSKNIIITSIELNRDKYGRSSVQELVYALLKAESLHPLIICLSIGSTNKRDWPVILQVVKKLSQNGICIVASLSNARLPTAPASFKEVIGVCTDSFFPYSDPIIYSVRKNKWGVNLFVTDRDIHYQKKLFCNWSPKDNNIYLPGNSFATPFVAAQLVYLRKNGIATNELTSFFPTAPSINPTSFIG